MAAQGPVDAGIELFQRDVAVAGPVFAQVMIEAQVYEDAGIAAQCRRELPAQLPDDGVTVGKSVYRPVQPDALFDARRQVAAQRAFVIVPLQAARHPLRVGPGELEVGQEIHG